jgi:hypothetical protein
MDLTTSPQAINPLFNLLPNNPTLNMLLIIIGTVLTTFILILIVYILVDKYWLAHDDNNNNNNGSATRSVNIPLFLFPLSPVYFPKHGN